MFNVDLNSSEYRFLDAYKDRIILLGFGGSHAYGTNVETSDVDLRGIYFNSIEELLGVQPDSEQFVETNTDTVLSSVTKN